MQALINAAGVPTSTERLYAASTAWTWTLDSGSTTAGVLAYSNTAQDAGVGTPANANFTIHLVGVQGLTGVNATDLAAFFPAS